MLNFRHGAERPVTALGFGEAMSPCQQCALYKHAIMRSAIAQGRMGLQSPYPHVTCHRLHKALTRSPLLAVLPARPIGAAVVAMVRVVAHTFDTAHAHSALRAKGACRHPSQCCRQRR